MKNTLRISLIVIGGAFLGLAVVYLIFKNDSLDTRQLLGMAGVGLLFILAGTSMGNR